jgi:hypothetical protein
MGYEWRDLTGLEKPEKLEPCWRCDHPPLEIAVAKLDAEDRKHRPGGLRTDLPAAHLCICSHCGYSVPAPDDDGFNSPELAALRWNGEMLAKRMKQERETRRMFLGATVEGAVQDAVAKASSGLPNVRIIVDGKEVARTVTTEGTDGYTASGDEDAEKRPSARDLYQPEDDERMIGPCGLCDSWWLIVPIAPEVQPGKRLARCSACGAECIVQDDQSLAWQEAQPE